MLRAQMTEILIMFDDSSSESSKKDSLIVNEKSEN